GRPSAGPQAWAIGEEQNYLAPAGALVKLGSRGIGLLVTQRYGFDHLKRSHLLPAPEGQHWHDYGARRKDRDLPGVPPRSCRSPPGTSRSSIGAASFLAPIVNRIVSTRKR